MNQSRIWMSIVGLSLLATMLVAGEPEINMYGNTPSRNMVLDAEGLPSGWEPKSGKNIKWSQALGSQAYAGPIIYDGKVFVGTNNEGLRNPELTGDRGNVMAFDAKTGEFLWQSTWPKLPAGRVNDWPLQGVCSTPAIEGNRLWYISNRGEVICADTEGFRDGKNNGPYTSWFETGQMESKGNFVNGKREGPWSYWKQDGSIQVKATGEYKDDRRVGK